MGSIQVLSFEVANLIAAGEVVDRPASAVKEMMENAIDAGARHVTVEIQNGGVSFMRVTDDGCGMSAEDLPMSIRRHATSKIRSAEDLDGIATLGFRGEALAAISSVSDMRIMSKRREDDMGHILEVQGGTILGVSEFGCQDGTTIIVEHLFANVPARRKFLKRDVTESMAVSANVERVALSHPEVAFRFIADGQIKLDTAGDGKLKSAVYAVFGRDFASRLIPLEYEFEGIRVDGFIGRSDNVKANRNGQNFFINHRYVKSRTAQAAIEQAFTSYLPPEKYPVCVMNIGLNPGRVDVNVHPAKLEVKFSNEKPIFEAVFYAVKQALEQDTSRPALGSDALKPAFGSQGAGSPTGSGTANAGGVRTYGSSFGRPGVRVSDMTTPVETEKPKPIGKLQISMDDQPAQPDRVSDIPTMEEFLQTYRDSKRGSGQSASPAGAPAEPQPPVPEEIPPFPDEVPPIPDEIPPLPDEVPPIPDEVPPLPDEISPLPDDAPAPAAVSAGADDTPAAPPYRIVGEVFHSYVIVEQGDRMLLIDKHAAHERIIFEKLRANLKKVSVDSQFMMLPVDVMLMSDEVGLIDTYRKELEAIGFSFTCLRNTVRVDSLPSGIETSAVPDMFAAFAEQLAHGTGDPRLTRDILFEKALFQASCKAAIKAGRDYPPEQVAWVVDQLMKIPDITFCPHGRPVAMEMKKRTLDHQFERC